jgi:hypothetical protein
MSTRAHIGIMDNKKNFEIIFTHWDGYPSHHGPILLNHYTNAKMVRLLLSMGSRETFSDNPFEGDLWGGTGGRSWKFSTLESMKQTIKNDSWAEYIYLFDVKHHKWLFAKLYGDNQWQLKTLTAKDCGRDQ